MRDPQHFGCFVKLSRDKRENEKLQKRLERIFFEVEHQSEIIQQSKEKSDQKILMVSDVYFSAREMSRHGERPK